MTNWGITPTPSFQANFPRQLKTPRNKKQTNNLIDKWARSELTERKVYMVLNTRNGTWTSLLTAVCWQGEALPSQDGAVPLGRATPPGCENLNALGLLTQPPGNSLAVFLVHVKRTYVGYWLPHCVQRQKVWSNQNTHACRLENG